MNFLAHLHLSQNDEDLMVGNFIADSVRSSEWDQFKPRVLVGIKLHHSIDEFTDSHPVVERSKILLRPSQGKYSPVVVDILYDHFLAKYFSEYSNVPLVDFANNAYAIFRKRWEELPAPVQHMIPYMERYNWLVNYGNREGLQSVFNGMSRRASFDNTMQKAVNDLYENYEALEADFREFYPELEANTKKVLVGL